MVHPLTHHCPLVLPTPLPIPIPMHVTGTYSTYLIQTLCNKIWWLSRIVLPTFRICSTALQGGRTTHSAFKVTQVLIISTNIWHSINALGTHKWEQWDVGISNSTSITLWWTHQRYSSQYMGWSTNGKLHSNGMCWRHMLTRYGHEQLPIWQQDHCSSWCLLAEVSHDTLRFSCSNSWCLNKIVTTLVTFHHSPSS